MSSNKRRGPTKTSPLSPPDSADPEAAEATEGWESIVEDDDESPSLAPNAELEEAMREAMEAVEARQGTRQSGDAAAPGDAPEAQAPAKPQAQIAALEDRLLRLHADFENFRRRTLKEKEQAYLYGHENLVKDLLPTVDNLERAIEHARKSKDGDLEGLLQGVELVLREFLGIFGQHGVTAIEAQGRPFDPAEHEAMAQAPDADAPPNTVIQVFEKGYRLRDRLLRPARVVVSRTPDEEAEKESEE